MSPKIKSAIVKTPQQPGKRRRVKKLHKDLLDQLEFYLSEASLRHDSFLREKAGERGMECIPIHVFLTFPLIQEMKVDKKNIITAIGNSRLLQISRDKEHIQRIFPITRPPHNLDRSTLYIENLPPDTTIEWVKEVCRKVGAVRHISLPRYKKSGALKGFAFVEFATPEDVARACRIFKDPPIYFYPNRAEKYLKYLNRLKMRGNMIDLALEISPVLQSDITSVPQSAESGLLSRSLDSALDFELEEDEVATSSGRKRKRRSRASSEAVNHEKYTVRDDGMSTHTPAKKLKSLPTQLRYEDCATGNKNCATIKNDCAITNTEHTTASNISAKTFSENCSKLDTVSMTTTKIRTLGRKVLFSINDENTDNSSKTDFSTKLTQKQVSEQNGIPCDVKFEIQRNKFCNKQCNTEEEIIIENCNISEVEEKHSESVENSNFLKRRRSCSEPSNIFDFAPVIEAKRIKGEVKDATTSNEPPIISPQKDNARNTQPITSDDIDAIITQGRRLAEATINENDLQSRRLLQSVVAKPEIKTPSKKRKKSRKSNKKDKLSTRQDPPQLIAMSKIQWIDLKKEYKHLQKHNMSRLKNTLKECKDAVPLNWSVFIKKHLDVLKDVNISNDSINSFESDDDNNDKKDKEDNKRGPPTFKPGVIVRISSPAGKKLPNISEIKSSLNKYGQGVAYVDTVRAENYGFVRFNDGDSAQRAIMEEKSLALCLLTGEAEERYWDKLLAARAQKFARERPKIRGRTKILLKAEGLVEKAKRRHIRFDNNLAV